MEGDCARATLVQALVPSNIGRCVLEALDFGRCFTAAQAVCLLGQGRFTLPFGACSKRLRAGVPGSSPDPF